MDHETPFWLNKWSIFVISFVLLLSEQRSDWSKVIIKKKNSMTSWHLLFYSDAMPANRATILHSRLNLKFYILLLLSLLLWNWDLDSDTNNNMPTDTIQDQKCDNNQYQLIFEFVDQGNKLNVMDDEMHQR